MSKMRELNKTRLNWVVILLVISTLYILSQAWHDVLLWHERHWNWFDLKAYTQWLVYGLPIPISFIFDVLMKENSFYQSLSLKWEFVCHLILLISTCYPLAILIGKWLSGINARYGLLASVLTYIISSLMVVAICIFIAFRI